ncbi:MAG: alpha/beta fold hydrolase [Burkholderiales bacterium]
MENVQTLNVTTPDAHRFEAKLFCLPDERAPVMIFLSALGTPARVYGRFAREMNLHGVQVCAPDWRGIGSSSVRAGRTSDFGYQHLIELDLVALIAAVRERLPHAPLWLGGHSLGGQLALLGAARDPDGIAGVVLIASGSVHHPCYSGKLRWAVRSLAWMSSVTGPLLGYFPGARVGFGGREAAGLMRDWSHVARTGEYRIEKSAVVYQQRMRALKLPILALSFAADYWSPHAAAQSLLKKFSASTPVHCHWDHTRTAGVTVDHYNWLKQPALVAPAVARYIRDLQPPPA